MCNQQLAYKHAFTYIRQLAVHLRDAIVSKKKENIAKVRARSVTDMTTLDSS